METIKKDVNEVDEVLKFHKINHENNCIDKECIESKHSYDYDCFVADSLIPEKR